jgi:hypothetical protein
MVGSAALVQRMARISAMLAFFERSLISLYKTSLYYSEVPAANKRTIYAILIHYVEKILLPSVIMPKSE